MVNTLTLQTAHDILHELCGMLGLQSEENLEEFGLHADLGKRTSTCTTLISMWRGHSVRDAATWLSPVLHMWWLVKESPSLQLHHNMLWNRHCRITYQKKWILKIWRCLPLPPTETLPLPLLPSDYIQDIVSMLETQELQYRLCFSKLLWYRPLNTDNALYVDTLYQQVMEFTQWER